MDQIFSQNYVETKSSTNSKIHMQLKNIHFLLFFLSLTLYQTLYSNMLHFVHKNCIKSENLKKVISLSNLYFPISSPLYQNFITHLKKCQSSLDFSTLINLHSIFCPTVRKKNCNKPFRLDLSRVLRKKKLDSYVEKIHIIWHIWEKKVNAVRQSIIPWSFALRFKIYLNIQQ